MSQEVNCLTCASPIELPTQVVQSEIVDCSRCGQDHEIVSVEGTPKLGFAPEVEEDWGE